MTLPLPLIHGVRLDFQGTCNRCGLCCAVQHEGQRVVCEHLLAEFPVKPLGHPEASRCRAYEYRSPARPLEIRMLDAHGTPKLVGRCFKDTPQEDHAIAPHLGNGCSLTMPISQGQLVKFEPAKRR